MIKIIRKFLYISCVFALVGCTYLQGATPEAKYPEDPDDKRRARAGSMLKDNGFLLFGGNKTSNDESPAIASSSGIGINSYLWRAALDTLSFMPLASADPFGGVIITDYYENPKAKGEKFKVNVYILNKKLRSDAVKVTVFKQIASGNSWKDTEVSDQVARDLENNILIRARELKVTSEKSPS